MLSFTVIPLCIISVNSTQTQGDLRTPAPSPSALSLLSERHIYIPNLLLDLFVFHSKTNLPG